MKKICAAMGLFLFLEFSFAFGQIDSQWRGPNRDGVWPNENLLRKWPDGGPELLWFAEGRGEGYSSPAVASDCVFLIGIVRAEGFLFAFDRKGAVALEGLLWSGVGRQSTRSPGDCVPVMKML